MTYFRIIISMILRLPSADLEILNLTELFLSIFVFIKCCHMMKDLKVSYYIFNIQITEFEQSSWWTFLLLYIW